MLKKSPKMTKYCEKNIANLCRVCGQRGVYSIFEKIPSYVHESEREALNWPKPIAYYLSAVIQVPIASTDHLPQKLCVLCISYMKHAFVFKSQALKNVTNFRRSDESPPHLEVPSSPPPPPLEDSSEEETVQQTPKLSSIFSYAQTSFEEDDLTSDLFLSNQISLYLPETFKERKCASCKRRFMFEDSYDEHVKDCIQLKLSMFIRELEKLLSLKEARSLSSHEFTRRCVFGIKKIVKELCIYDPSFKVELMRSKGAEGRRTKSDDCEKVSKTLTKPPLPQIAAFSLSETENCGTNTSSSPQTFYIRCPQCDSRFESLTELEAHNFTDHNRIVDLTPRRRVANVIMEDTKRSPISFGQHSTPQNAFPRIRNRLQEESSDAETKKLVKCLKCNLRFQTITHLDLHVAKSHTKSPVVVSK